MEKLSSKTKPSLKNVVLNFKERKLPFCCSYEINYSRRREIEFLSKNCNYSLCKYGRKGNIKVTGTHETASITGTKRKLSA